MQSARSLILWSLVAVCGCLTAAGTVTAQVVTMHLDRIDPDETEPGAAITIRGRGFGESRGSKILMMTQGRLTTLRTWRMGVSSWSDTEIRGSVPRTVAAGNYSVVIALNDSPLAPMSNALTLRVAAPWPRVFSSEPREGPGGTIITIHGRGFGRERGSSRAGLQISEHYNPMEIRSWSDTEVQVIAPPDISTGDYEIRLYPEVERGAWEVPGHFRVITLPMSLSSAEPAEGLPGQEVRIHGRNFARRDRKVVTMNRDGHKYLLEIVGWYDWGEISTRLPHDLSPGEYAIVVYYDDSYRESTNSVRFRINEFPVINSVTPTTGPRDTEVVIRGRNFGADQGQKAIAFSRGLSGLPDLYVMTWSDTEIHARVPNVRPGRYGISIYFTRQHRGSSNSVDFTLVK